MPNFDFEQIHAFLREKLDKCQLERGHRLLEKLKGTTKNLSIICPDKPTVVLGFKDDFFSVGVDHSRILEELLGKLKMVSSANRAQYIIISKDSVESPQFFPEFRA